MAKSMGLRAANLAQIDAAGVPACPESSTRGTDHRDEHLGFVQVGELAAGRRRDRSMHVARSAVAPSDRTPPIRACGESPPMARYLAQDESKTAARRGSRDAGPAGGSSFDLSDAGRRGAAGRRAASEPAANGIDGSGCVGFP